MASNAALPGEITALLTRWNEGDRNALTGLATLAYEDLRTIAAGFLRTEGRNHTLQATGLVNELYLRLCRQTDLQATSRQHFYALAAMIMRRILQDYARRSHALKRPGGQAMRVPLHEDMAWVDASSEDILALNQALNELEKIDARAVRIIELRYFLGATNIEVAGLIGISKATVDRDLEFAKAWIYRRLSSKLGRKDP
ncbi:MAG: ECF-type sigma factor [Bryobacteraceae bacterium]|jgi:RNA polymerase sigma factor (TIGR02999 family)